MTEHEENKTLADKRVQIYVKTRYISEASELGLTSLDQYIEYIKADKERAVEAKHKQYLAVQKDLADALKHIEELREELKAEGSGAT